MNYLVYLVYGGVQYNHEALYALLSFYKYHAGNTITVVLYTDDEAFFNSQLPQGVVYVGLSPETITEWKGASGFNHRLKIKALQDACTRFKGNILYCDTDTHFTRNAEHLFATVAQCGIVFHKAEGALATGKGNVARKMRAFFAENPEFTIPSESQPLHITSALQVWNAGVIGFSTQYAPVLQKVVELTDAFCQKSDICVLEQVAFNYYFQQLAVPVSAEKEVEHYWYFKEFRQVLANFFQHHSSTPFNILVAETDKILPYNLSEEKRAYKRMGFWQKQWTKLSKGAKWRITPYRL